VSYPRVRAEAGNAQMYGRYLTALDTSGSELIVPVVADDLVVGTLDVEDGRIGALGKDD
jgi:putative methionine-R-sulfoxide reductase with GAF domain